MHVLWDKSKCLLPPDAVARNRVAPLRCGGVIGLFLTSKLLDIEYQTVWVFDVAARNSRILFDYRATGGDESPLGLLNVRHKKVEDRPVFFAPFHVQAKSTGFKTYDRFRFALSSAGREPTHKTSALLTTSRFG